MGNVTVTPEQFTLVFFDSDLIRERATEIAAKVGLDADIHLEVDESSPVGHVRVRSVEPIELFAEGGSFEEPKRPRHLSERNLSEALGRLLFRVKDRLDPRFAEAPADEELSLQQQNVWDTYSLGRLARAGFDVAKPRWLYHFRTRQGFTDVSDAAFARLWTADELTWKDLEAIRTETEQARTAA